jgi:Tfp pilus assembly ATPase PilU
LAPLRTHHFDDSLYDLVSAGTVELAEALKLAEDPQQLRARASLQSVA